MSERKVVLSIPSVFGYEEVVVETVGTVARVQRFPFEKVSKLKTAVAEACINAIEHGNQADPDKDVLVTIVCDDTSMHVSIKDFGKGHLEPSFNMPDIRKQIQERQLGGWGMYIIHSLVDEVEVDSDPNTGTTTTMVIYSEGESTCEN